MKIKFVYVLALMIQGAWAQNPFSLKVLGTIQDAGSPHISCTQKCCNLLSMQEKQNRKVSCLALQNNQSGDYYIFDATPDFAAQIRMMHKSKLPTGIFITHAHIGHFTGLMYLGKEAKDAREVPVYVMPRMRDFLAKNGPWSQLVSIKNITLHTLSPARPQTIEEGLNITPLLVPHRDEYSETVGYYIQTNNKSVLYIPDIDKWEKWSENIEKWISKVDLAFIDATFYDAKEVKRDLSEIPHPFVVESVQILKGLSRKDKSKVYFIHLNHSNPLLNTSSEAYKSLRVSGFRVAKQGDIFML